MEISCDARHLIGLTVNAYLYAFVIRHLMNMNSMRLHLSSQTMKKLYPYLTRKPNGRRYQSAQISILLTAWFAESIISQSISPYLNQVQYAGH
jgi:hypothetical protein